MTSAITKYGPGDSATWGAPTNHPGDPRNDGDSLYDAVVDEMTAEAYGDFDQFRTFDAEYELTLDEDFLKAVHAAAMSPSEKTAKALSSALDAFIERKAEIETDRRQAQAAEDYGYEMRDALWG